MAIGMHNTEKVEPKRRRSTYRPPEKVVEVPAKEAFAGLDSESFLMAPPVLYTAGDLSLLNAPYRVSIIGSRDASPDGLKRAARLARLLAEAGVVVVSGLAKGIDSAAHEAAIQAGGKTLAVIGTPLQRAYPAENAALQETIYRDHLLVSQFSPTTKTFPSHFIARNRTMAMLSHASVIVEAGETSGSLSQAAETQRLGRQLFIMRNVMFSGLEWPHKFLNALNVPVKAAVLDDVGQILRVLGV